MTELTPDLDDLSLQAPAEEIDALEYRRNRFGDDVSEYVGDWR